MTTGYDGSPGISENWTKYLIFTLTRELNMLNLHRNWHEWKLKMTQRPHSFLLDKLGKQGRLSSGVTNWFLGSKGFLVDTPFKFFVSQPSGFFGSSEVIGSSTVCFLYAALSRIVAPRVGCWEASKGGLRKIPWYGWLPIYWMMKVSLLKNTSTDSWITDLKSAVCFDMFLRNQQKGNTLVFVSKMLMSFSARLSVCCLSVGFVRSSYIYILSCSLVYIYPQPHQ